MYSKYLIRGINVIKNNLRVNFISCSFFSITRNLNNKKLFCYILVKISENGKIVYINVISRRRLLDFELLYSF